MRCACTSLRRVDRVVQALNYVRPCGIHDMAHNSVPSVQIIGQDPAFFCRSLEFTASNSTLVPPPLGAKHTAAKPEHIGSQALKSG